MKKLLGITLTTLLVLFASQAFGQTVDDEISASANIISEVTVNGDEDLEFGDVIAGTNGVIEIDEGDRSILSSNTSTPQLGQFTLTGSDGEAYSLSVLFPSELSDGTNSLPFTMNGNDFGNIDGSADNAGESENGNFNPNDGTDVEFANGNNITVLLGGQVEPTSGQASGNYTGSVTLEVSPTSF